MILLLLLTILPLWASDIPGPTLIRLKSIYPDQTESFIRKRVEVALTAQEKWTAFPPYFYQLVDRSKDIVGNSLSSRQGLCAGDAHLENFGYLYSDKPEFRLNDLDDSTPCSLDADAMRLFIGHRLLMKMDVKDWMAAYKSGLRQEARSLPHVLKDLKEKSLSGGRKISKKMEKLFDGKKCDGEYSTLSDIELQSLKRWSASQGQQFEHGCSRTKIKGGSAGYKRFIVFHDKNVSELKPLNRPAPLYAKSVSLAERMAIYKNSVRFFLGKAFVKDYFPVVFEGKLYQHRPSFAGNEAVDENDLSSNELKEIIYYEAYILGRYHSYSTSRGPSQSFETWENVALKLEQRWRSEFAE